MGRLFGNRLGIWTRVVWRPILAVIGGIYAVAAAFTFVRDALLPVFFSARDTKAWQNSLAPEFHIDWYWWAIGILAGLLVVVLEGAFRVVQKEGADFATERTTLTTAIQELESVRALPDFDLSIRKTLTGIAGSV